MTDGVNRRTVSTCKYFQKWKR